VELTEIVKFNWKPLYLEKSFLHQKYVVERLSCQEIADQIFSARSTVLKYLKHFDIPVRNTSDKTYKAGCGLSYGKRNVKGSEVEYKREMENIRRMRELREKGFSYHKIADVFNSMGVPTKTRKGKWSGKTVWQILNANLGTF
jgi:hypothetical protein